MAPRAANIICRLTPRAVREAVATMAKGVTSRDLGPTITLAETSPAAGGVQVDVARQESYGQSVWVYKCASAIARAVGELPVTVKRRQRDGSLVEAPDHPAQALMGWLNPGTWPSAFWQQITTHLLLFGAAAVSVERGAGGVPSELHPLQPQWLELSRSRPDPKRGHVWEYGRPGAATRRVVFHDDELIQPRFLNPMDPAQPWSPLNALRVGINADYAAQLTNLAMFQNGGRPDGVLKTEQRLDEFNRSKLREMWRNTFGGARNAHRIAILSHGLEYQEIQRSLRDMEFTQGRQITRDEILACYGVPPLMAGVLSTGLGESETTQRQMFYTEAVLPIAGHLDQSIGNALALAWPKDPPVLTRDLSSIEHVIGRRAEIIAQGLQLIGVGAYTANDLLSDLGLDPKPWGSTWYMPFNLAPVSDLSEPQEPATQAPVPVPEAPAKAWASSTPRRRVVIPHGLVGMKRASVLRLMTSMGRAFRADVEAILRDFAGTITTDAENPFDRDSWAQTLAERGAEPIAGMIWRAWQREDEILRAAAKAFRKDVGMPVDLEGLPGIFVESQLAQQYLAGQLQRFATTIPETVWERTRASLVAGIRDGASERDLAARVQKEMADYIASSAQTIARTEAHAAANEGTVARWGDGGEIGTHQWSAVGDENTRQSHVDADGQEVALGDEFEVGGSRLEYPGDPGGDPEETINCRCITLGVLRSDD